MSRWMEFPQAGRFTFGPPALKRDWAALHAGDREPWPDDVQMVRAWALFHAGDFEAAWREGQRRGVAGLALACKAACIYATHMEPEQERRQTLYQEVAELTQARTEREPEHTAAWFWQAYALGRYSQGISVAKALAQGLGTRVRTALERTLALEPSHADAHIALGAFHAEVIDKVGLLIGSMTYGAKKDVGLRHYQKALALHPNSPMAMVEYGNALLMMDGDKAHAQATDLFKKAAACTPMDAMQWLEVQLARQELQALQQAGPAPNAKD